MTKVFGCRGFPSHVGLPDDIIYWYIYCIIILYEFISRLYYLIYQVKHVLNIYIDWYLLFFSSLCRTGSQFHHRHWCALCTWSEVFVIEVVVKLLLLSPRVYFTGTNYAWNIGAPFSCLSQPVFKINGCQWMSMVERKHIKYIKSKTHDLFERKQLRNLSFCTDHCMGRSPAVDPWFNPMEYVLLFGTQKNANPRCWLLINYRWIVWLMVDISWIYNNFMMIHDISIVLWCSSEGVLKQGYPQLSSMLFKTGVPPVIIHVIFGFSIW